jgi:flagellar hook protein FlgE
MLRSMYSGIGGMRGFQNKLDVIGNNIANVNTAGFKKSRIQFQDILSQTVAGAQAPNATQGGINPKQIGLGSTVSSIDVVHTQGGLMTTNVPSDLAIQGNGFFVVNSTPLADTESKGFYLTRAGNFNLDANGNLVTSDGKFVLNGAGKEVNLYNLTATAVDPAEYNIKSYSIAQDGSITATFEHKTDPVANPEIKNTSEDANYKLAIAYVTNPGGLEKKGGSLYAWTPAADMNNGGTAGDEGKFKMLAGEATKGGRGQIISGQLEMSNVDLAEEFTEMIVAQRGFQANSRIITTSDSILEELVNLKRQ